MLIGVPFLFLLLHLIDSRGGEEGGGVEVPEEDTWTREENHTNGEEEGTGRTKEGSAGENGEGSEKGEEGEEEGGGEGSEHKDHVEQEGDGDSEVVGFNLS